MRAFMRLATLGMGVAVAGVPVVAAAPGNAPPTPPAVQRLLDCRGIADTQQRLACFDRESATVASDLGRRDLVVVDRGQMTRTRRTLFGLELPRLDILGDTAADEVKQIESNLQSFGPNRDGGLLFVLADGTRWSQTDSTTLDVPPQRGDKVRVRKAALGSFILVLQGQAPVKVKRVQ